jgi:hypothetical protein
VERKSNKTAMSYTKKLEDFNASPKYVNELGFLRSLIGDTLALDYGCGNGFAAELFKCDGFDVTPHNPFFGYVETPYNYYETVYFMHSLAHIENPETVLRSLNIKPGGRVVVITPNKDWLDKISREGYIPDPTVIEHFTGEALDDLFMKSGYKIVRSGQFGQRIGSVNERLFMVAKRKL